MMMMIPYRIAQLRMDFFIRKQGHDAPRGDGRARGVQGVVPRVGVDHHGLGRRFGRVHVVVGVLDRHGRRGGQGLQAADQPRLAARLGVLGHGPGVLGHPVHLEGVGVVPEPEHTTTVEPRQGERLHHLGHPAHVATRLAVPVPVLPLVHLEEDEGESLAGVDDEIDEGTLVVHITHTLKVDVLLTNKVPGWGSGVAELGALDVSGLLLEGVAADPLFFLLAPGLALFRVVAFMMPFEIGCLVTSIATFLALEWLLTRVGALVGLKATWL